MSEAVPNNKTKTQRNFTKIETISRHLYCTICQEVFYFPHRINCR